MATTRRTIKKAASKRTSRSSTGSSRTHKAPPAATIRMYRIGVGDCFLVSLPREGKKEPFRMLIDCGVHMAQSGGPETIRRVAEDIVETTGGHVDVIVGTHEHWDHISGFKQAEQVFQAGLSADEVWLGWTEDDGNPTAQKLAKAKKKSLTALSKAVARMHIHGFEANAQRVEGLLGFFGDGAGKKLGEAGAVLKSLCKKAPRYMTPTQKPLELAGTNARVFVLGPPVDETLLRRDKPSKANSEVYGFGSQLAAAEVLDRALSESGTPFDETQGIPLEASRSDAFFAGHYWEDFVSGPLETGEETTQSFRRIEDAWLGSSEALALHLDSATNNTSLVLAIELGAPDEDGPVLLFTADAQVGSWLSWQSLRWKYKGREITGPDLLARTIVYKVGHHASHNATLKELGLELMDELEVALVPTDADMAKKVGWGTLPWPALIDRLETKTKKHVIATDEDRKASSWGRYKLTKGKDELYYELSITHD